MEVMDNVIKKYRQGMGVAGLSTSYQKNYKQEAGGSVMANTNVYQKYQQNAVNTANPQELTLMLYNGLVRFLKIAIQAIEEKNIEKANNNIIRSQDIIMEFICALDMKYEVSHSLMSMYDYMNRRLVEANVKKDKSIVEEVLGFAEELRDTWAQAMKLAKQQSVLNK